jgi:hypothetical protein
VHQEKIQDILDFPRPMTLTELKGFLGICCYRKRFFKGFTQIFAPLTDLTKKGAFKWNQEAHMTFEKMNKVMSIVGTGVDPGFNATTMHQQNPNYWPFQQHLQSR